MNYPLRLLPWLSLAAVADWLLSRTFTRAAIFMPKPPVVIVIYQALNLAGQVVATLVGLLCLAMLTWIAWREWRLRRTAWLPLVLLGQVGFNLSFLISAPSAGWMIANQLLSLIAVGLIVWPAWWASQDDSGRATSAKASHLGWNDPKLIALLLPALAFLAGRFYQVIPALYVALQWPGPSPLTEPLFNLGELLVGLSTVGLWYAYGRLASWRIWLAAALPAATVSAFYWLNPALAGTLAIWSTGLTLYLPWPLYALSLWLAGATVIVSLRRGNPAGWAILLLAAGGYAPQLSVQVFLGVIALWILAQPVIPLAGLSPMIPVERTPHCKPI
ncbi:MAG: hypothetical protein U0401_05075 [Anaerolineae bacterium]